MRDDLLDAQAAVDWAVAQIPILEERFAAYQRRRPYDIVMESDPKKAGDMLMVAYSLGAPDAILNADVGAIINSIRSSLDLLFTAIVGRNGKKFGRDTHLPFRIKAADFLNETKAMEKKQWLSKTEAAAIKKMRLHKRGNRAVYLINQLDIMRKHRKLIEVRPVPGAIQTPMYLHSIRGVWRYGQSKSVLLRFPGGTDFRPTKDNCEITLQIAFYEPRLGLLHAPVVPTLRHFAEVAANIIAQFNVP